MEELLSNLSLSIKHLEILNEVLKYSNDNDKIIYEENLNKLKESFNKINLYNELYNQKNRQMILADLIEYILLGRGYYSMKDLQSKEYFVKGVLHFVNLLMSFEILTVDIDLRKKYLKILSQKIKIIKSEEYFDELLNYNREIGLPNSNAPDKLQKYFDKLLPKTAGGLWHELLVYIFLLRNNIGYILPLLLNQRLYSKEDHIVPPDFLILNFDKRIYGVEVGIKKEIQSGSFSLKTAIPTATIDTINSRNSDRCPICKKWIHFCPFVIKNYSNFKKVIDKIEVRCLENCDIYNENDVLRGECKFTKYSRKETKTLKHTKHKFADGYHYHYSCVLNNLEDNIKKTIISSKDSNAIKTHYPYYSGLEELIKII